MSMSGASNGLAYVHHPVVTASAPAQAAFDRGLTLLYAFERLAARQSFEEAAKADPSCAMAHWGIALALGPNYNKPWESFDPVDLSSAAKPQTGADQTSSATGLAAVQAAVDFPVIAPDTLVGLPRQDVRTVKGNNALVVYGQGLGAIIVVERKTDTTAGQQGGPMAALPSVSLDGLTGHELATQLGTAIEWQRNGVSFVLAGSLPPAAAESAARALK